MEKDIVEVEHSKIDSMRHSIVAAWLGYSWSEIWRKGEILSGTGFSDLGPALRQSIPLIRVLAAYARSP